MKKSLLQEKGLSLERLMSLHLVQERGGVAKAAPGDVITQNLIGRQLRELEMFFHTKLTAKEGKVVALNKEGQELASMATMILDGIEDFKHRVTGARRRFTIGTGGTLYDELAASRLAALAKYNFELHLDEYYKAELFEQLASSSIDAAISWEIPPHGHRFERRLLGKFSYALIGNKKLLTNLRQEEECFSNPMVIVKHRDIADEVKKRLRTDEIVYVNEYIAALRLVETGRYVAILPRLFEERLPKKIFTAVELKFLSSYTRTVYFYWNSTSVLRRGFSRAMIEEMTKAFVI